jgi:hypothetical protein
MSSYKYASIANTWKSKQITKLLALRDEMIEHNIDSEKIKEYVDMEYNKINITFMEKLRKHKENSMNKEQKELLKKKKKEIDFLLKNKTTLEINGVNKESIDKYAMNKYNQINEKYSKKEHS